MDPLVRKYFAALAQAIAKNRYAKRPCHSQFDSVSVRSFQFLALLTRS